MKDTGIEITGLAEVKKELDRLPAAIRDQAMKKALIIVGKNYLQALENTAPVGAPRIETYKGRKYTRLGGTLRNSFRVRRKITLGSVDLSVGIDKKQKGGMPGAWYSHFVEFGTSQRPGTHFIERAAKALRVVNVTAYRDEIRRTLKRIYRKQG